VHRLALDEGHDRATARLDKVKHRGSHAGGRRGQVVAVLAFTVDERIGAIARDAQHELADARPARFPVDRDEVLWLVMAPSSTS